MTYTKARDLSVLSSFIEKVFMSISAAAIAISAEAPETANHANRVSLAWQVLVSPDSWSKLFAVGCALNATVQDQPNDANIDAAVSSFGMRMRGVRHSGKGSDTQGVG